MSIDWVTVSAQIINFLVLVWLLKHFLYTPVTRAMDKREQRVTRRLKDAQLREQAAEQLGERYVKQSAELEQHREKLLQIAQDDASEIKQALLREARDDVAQTRTSWLQQIELEKQQFLESLQKQVAQSVSKVAHKALVDLADSDLETQAINTFLKRLAALPKSDLEQLKKHSKSIIIKSSFTISDVQQKHVTDVVQTLLQTTTLPSYEPLTDKGWGVELDVEEQRLGWNIDSYLDDLNKQFTQTLKSCRG